MILGFVLILPPAVWFLHRMWAQMSMGLGSRAWMCGCSGMLLCQGLFRHFGSIFGCSCPAAFKPNVVFSLLLSEIPVSLPLPHTPNNSRPALRMVARTHFYIPSPPQPALPFPFFLSFLHLCTFKLFLFIQTLRFCYAPLSRSGALV